MTGARARRALVTGFTGQDGSFLSELLLEQGYEVTGVVRGAPREPLGASEHLRDRVHLVVGDLADPPSLRAAVHGSAADEVYHLAAPSYVPRSWERPGETMSAIVAGTAAVLEAVRELGSSSRVFVAASGAMYGDAGAVPQDEQTPCRPDTPYAVAKLAAHQLVGALREHDGLYACSGIVFNHESERRSPAFVTRKITRAAAAISLGLASECRLGDLDAVRDWSFAGDVMRGAWMMLQHATPGDYVLASGVARTVGELARVAFACVDLDFERFVRVDPELVRTPEGTPSVGDAGRARRELGWEPRVTFGELVERMVRADLADLGSPAARVGRSHAPLTCPPP